LRAELNGRYEIVKSEGQELTIELFNQNGNTNSERVQVGINVDREAGTITIQGQGPFTRFGP
jgi:hypothetical protein